MRISIVAKSKENAVTHLTSLQNDRLQKERRRINVNNKREKNRRQKENSTTLQKSK